MSFSKMLISLSAAAMLLGASLAASAAPPPPPGGPGGGPGFHIRAAPASVRVPVRAFVLLRRRPVPSIIAPAGIRAGASGGRRSQRAS